MTDYDLRIEIDGFDEALARLRRVEGDARQTTQRANDSLYTIFNDIRDAKAETAALEVNSGKVVRQVGEAINQSWEVLQRYISIAGVSLRGVSGSVIRSVFAGIASLKALATAQLSNVFTAFMALATFQATTFASIQAMEAQVTAKQEERRLEKLELLMNEGYVVRT